jgi:LmbE family N-acetylglucosaminyl deacetylase
MHPPAGYDVAAPRLPEHRQAPPRGRTLCFAPHPDDEVIGPGGALCLHRAQADAVRVVVASDGAAGDPDRRFAAAHYPELRRAESRAGLAELGVSDVRFWGLPDSCVVTEADLEGLAERAAAEIAEFRAEVVYLPWQQEVNSDHRAVYSAVARALERSRFAGIAFGYEVWTAMIPDVLLDITPVADRKRRAVACYRTQLAYVDYAHPIFGLHAHRSLLFGRGVGWFEGFQRIG